MRRCVALLVIWMAMAVAARGHVVTQIFAEWKDGSPWEIEVLFDAGYAVPEWRDDANTPAPSREWLVSLGESGWAPLRVEAERYLREGLTLESGGGPVGWQVEFVDFRKTPPDFPELLNDGAYFRMRLVPEAAAAGPVDLKWAGGTRPSFVLKLPGQDSRYLTLAPGQSAPLPSNEREDSGRPPWIEAFRQGFLHVLPGGIDHILFVMGLFFYRRQWTALLSQSLAFTAAHTVTLGLAAAGIVRVTGAWVEPLVAISLTVVALENLRPGEKGQSILRHAIVFGFGLVHGLGFAGALSLWLKPGEGFFTGLVSANLGVEAAQVAIMGAAWMLTIGWHRAAGYSGFRRAGCHIIAGAGLLLAIDRIL
ncbi:MAG: HupE/UreJ family protein [Verrucomicrobiaceae bacterium]|nr:MAG: HupE/UreJ family protein [Verrucomicrobiaceae bacterium]